MLLRYVECLPNFWREKASKITFRRTFAWAFEKFNLWLLKTIDDSAPGREQTILREREQGNSSGRGTVILKRAFSTSLEVSWFDSRFDMLFCKSNKILPSNITRVRNIEIIELLKIIDKNLVTRLIILRKCNNKSSSIESRCSLKEGAMWIIHV